MLTQDQLDSAVWGTGYGSKRHLVDHERSQLRVATSWGPRPRIYARCSLTTHIEAALDTADPRGLLTRRTDCAHCRKIADAADRKVAESA